MKRVLVFLAEIVFGLVIVGEAALAGSLVYRCFIDIPEMSGWLAVGNITLCLIGLAVGLFWVWFAGHVARMAMIGNWRRQETERAEEAE